MRLIKILGFATPPNVSIYGVPKPEPVVGGLTSWIIFFGVVAIGIVAGIIILLKHAFKKKPEQAQGLYGPPKMFEPPQDLYGCPRPDEPEEITEENSKEN